MPVNPSEIQLVRHVDKVYTARPFLGSRKIAQELKREGCDVNRKHIQRIMRLLGLAGCQPGQTTASRIQSTPNLLGNVVLVAPLEAWGTDITYIRWPNGHVYLVAAIGWFSRFVLSYRLSNNLETSFCLEPLEDVKIRHGRPKTFNTDQQV